MNVIISVITAVVAIVALYVSIDTSKRNRKQNEDLSQMQHDQFEQLAERQRQLFIFNEYTRRYEQIMVSMPQEILPDENGVRHHAMLYFNLCSEEFYLHKKGLLPDEIWKMWLDGMRLTMKVIPYQTQWKSQSQFYSDDFCNFFDLEVIRKPNITLC